MIVIIPSVTIVAVKSNFFFLQGLRMEIQLDSFVTSPFFLWNPMKTSKVAGDEALCENSNMIHLFHGERNTLYSISPYQTWELWNAGWPPPSCAAPFLGRSLWSVLIGPSAPPAPFLWDWLRCEPAVPTRAPSRCPRSAEDDDMWYASVSFVMWYRQ